MDKDGSPAPPTPQDSWQKDSQPRTSHHSDSNAFTGSHQIRDQDDQKMPPQLAQNTSQRMTGGALKYLKSRYQPRDGYYDCLWDSDWYSIGPRAKYKNCYTCGNPYTDHAANMDWNQCYWPCRVCTERHPGVVCPLIWASTSHLTRHLHIRGHRPPDNVQLKPTSEALSFLVNSGHVSTKSFKDHRGHWQTRIEWINPRIESMNRPLPPKHARSNMRLSSKKPILLQEVNQGLTPRQLRSRQQEPLLSAPQQERLASPQPGNKRAADYLNTGVKQEYREDVKRPRQHFLLPPREETPTASQPQQSTEPTQALPYQQSNQEPFAPAGMTQGYQFHGLPLSPQAPQQPIQLPYQPYQPPKQPTQLPYQLPYQQLPQTYQLPYQLPQQPPPLPYQQPYPQPYQQLPQTYQPPYQLPQQPPPLLYQQLYPQPYQQLPQPYQQPYQLPQQPPPLSYQQPYPQPYQQLPQPYQQPYQPPFGLIPFGTQEVLEKSSHAPTAYGDRGQNNGEIGGRVSGERGGRGYSRGLDLRGRSRGRGRGCGSDSR